MAAAPVNASAQSGSEQYIAAKVLALVVVALVIYFPALRGGFVWNDLDYVTKPALRSVHGLWRIWTELGATEQYYPLLHGAFWVEHRLWGDHPLGYHLVNLGFHVASALLVWRILRRLDIPGAWLAALFFVAHPVCVESVAWISEQKNTLSTLLYLVAAWFYLEFDARRRRTDYILGLAVFIGALLAKSVTATLPAAILVIFWWRRGRLNGRRDVWPLLPWLGIGAASGLFSGWVERTYIGARGSDFALTAGERAMVAGRAIWFYLGKLVWPAGLNFIYPHWDLAAGRIAGVVAIIATLAATAVLWKLRRRTRAPLAAWLIFVGSLFPTLGFFNIYAFVFSYVADHWQYLASIAVLALAAAGIARGTAGAARPARLVWVAGTAALVVVLAALSWREAGKFRDIKTFYTSILARNPAAWMAQNNLGIALEEEGNLPGAIDLYEAVVRARPSYAKAQSNLGVALSKTGRLDDAISHYAVALRLEPENAVIYNDVGVALAQQGHVAEAVAQYETAARLDPAYIDAPLNLGVAYFRLQRFHESAVNYERALQLKPDNANAENCLGLALANDHRPDEAIVHYHKAIALSPTSADARCNLGAVLGSLGRFEEAIPEFEAAIRVDPMMADAHYNLGLVLALKHDYEPSIVQFQAASKLRAGFANAEFHWAWALQALGRKAEAQPILEEAVRDAAAAPAGGHP